jgi:hypothetical protein
MIDFTIASPMPIPVGLVVKKGSLPFVLLAALLAGVPVIVLILLGKRANIILPRIRDWIDTNSWIVNEIVIGFFLVMTIAGLENG